MRSESEMLELILSFAKDDDQVRSVILNGSRADKSVQRDIFQDYDIVFIVSSVDGFVLERSWIKSFGELLIMQTPDENVLFPPSNDNFAFLMLFTMPYKDLALRTQELHRAWDNNRGNPYEVSIV